MWGVHLPKQVSMHGSTEDALLCPLGTNRAVTNRIWGTDLRAAFYVDSAPVNRINGDIVSLSWPQAAKTYPLSV